MLCLCKKTDYALIALAHLAQHPGQVISAREIASVHGLPGALLMNILKSLHQKDLLSSTRGVKGGYKIAADLDTVTLYELVNVLEGNVDPAQRIDEANGTPSAAPVKALHYKLIRFLQDIKLSDLVFPGRRIDVPLELVQKQLKSNRSAPQRPESATAIVV